MISALTLISGIKEWQMERKLKEKLKELKPGDVIRFYRGYEHWAIYIGMKAGGEESVIHWWTNGDTVEHRIWIHRFRTVKDNLYFEKIKLDDVERNMHDVQKAISFKNKVDSMQGERNYRGLFKNSKHFVDWCLNGLIFIGEEEILNVNDPWRFVNGTVTNRHMLNNDTIYHNSMVLRDLILGDVVRYFYQDYEHWVLYVGQLEGEHKVIHWWDRDGVDAPQIAIGTFFGVAGHCKAEIERNKVPVNGDQAVRLATAFIERVQGVQRVFPDIANLFDDSREFAFWCRFGLGAGDLTDLPPMTTEAQVRGFVDERKRFSDHSFITTQHNNTIREKLRLGDVVTFSHYPHKDFAVCVGGEIPGVSHLIWWRDGPESPIAIDPLEIIAKKRKAMIYTDRDNLEGIIEWDGMVTRARTLMRRVNNPADDCTGLFSNSMHFANWVFVKYGIIKPPELRITVEDIERVTDVWQHVYELRSSSKIAEDKVTIRQQNKGVLGSLQKGDLITFQRTRYMHYMHYAVFTGRYEENYSKYEENELRSAVPGALSVIHWWSGPNADILFFPPKAWIRIDSFWTVASYDRADIGNDMEFENRDIDGHKVAETAKQAQKKFEEEWNINKTKQSYNILINNCEHFAYWCRYGKYISKQVQRNLPYAVLLIIRIIIAILPIKIGISRILLAMQDPIEERAKQILLRCMQKKDQKK